MLLKIVMVSLKLPLVVELPRLKIKHLKAVRVWLTLPFPGFPKHCFIFTKLSPVTSLWHVGTVTSLLKDPASSTGLPCPLWAVWMAFSTLAYLSHCWLIWHLDLWEPLAHAQSLQYLLSCLCSPLLHGQWRNWVQDLLPKLSEWVSLEIYKLLEATGVTVNSYNLANAHAPPSDLNGKDWAKI